MHKASRALPPLACSLACLLTCSLACSHVAMQPRSQAALFVLPSCPTYLLACLLACSLDCLLASLARLLACVLAAMQPFLTTCLQPAAPFCLFARLFVLKLGFARLFALSLARFACLPACQPAAHAAHCFVCLPLSFFVACLHLSLCCPLREKLCARIAHLASVGHRRGETNPQSSFFASVNAL